MTRKKFNKAEFVKFCQKAIRRNATRWTEYYDLEEAYRKLTESELFDEDDWIYNPEKFKERVLHYFPSLEAYEFYRDFMSQ